MYQIQARNEFEQASRKAVWARFLARLEGMDTGLLDFNDIAQDLNLRTAVYRGLQLVPLDKIVGSVGRYQDFTGAFLPVSDSMRERWQRIATLYLDPNSAGAPPIEAYKVGASYFVKDGNHRVSVANQLGIKDIEAYVWEYAELVAGMDTDTDIDTLLIEAERQDFLTQTNLDELRPAHNIQLTAPGGYTEMLRQIGRYQKVLSQIDGEPMSYPDAVKAWYDMLYETTTQLIKDEGVLPLFPDRTIADFFVWVTRYQQDLKAHYKDQMLVREIAQEIPRRYNPGILRRLWLNVLRWLLNRLSS